MTARGPAGLVEKIPLRSERLIPFVCLVLLPFIPIRARAGDEPAAPLFDEIGRSDLLFASSIGPLEKRRSGLRLVDAGTVISSRFRTSACGQTQRERIEIDTGELREGAFRLSFEVTDERTKETVTAEGRFSVVE